MHENFNRRAESYTTGLKLLIEYLLPNEGWQGNKPENIENINKKIQTIYDNFTEKISNTSFEENVVHFNFLLAEYNKFLTQNTHLTNSFESLCIAERCGVWLTGRESFSTPFFKQEKNEQASEVLPPFEEQKLSQSEDPAINDAQKSFQIKEFAQLDSNPPLWFKQLPAWQQNFIKNNKEKLAGQPIPSSLRSIPGLANLSKHTLQINGKAVLSYMRHATQLPVDLLMEKTSVDEQFRLTCLNQAAQIKLSIENHFTSHPSRLDEVVILSQSFLSPGLAATLKSVFTGPSDNDTKIYTVKEEVIELFKRALVQPHEIISDKDHRIKALFFDQNERNKPLTYGNFLAKFDLEAQANKKFKYKNHRPIAITLLSTNHPFNLLRRLGTHSEQTQRNNTNTAELMGAIARYLSQNLSSFKNRIDITEYPFPEFLKYLEQNPLNETLKNNLRTLINTLLVCEREKALSIFNKEKLLKLLEGILEIKKSLKNVNDSTYLESLPNNTLQLIDALQALLLIPDSQGVLQSDRFHNQMQLSIAEIHIINYLKGNAWIACKSGKDRTGIASAALDATSEFIATEKKYPCMSSNSDRELYINLFKKFLNSGHQQKLAGQNAPGSNGLVNSNFSLPKDMYLDADYIYSETQLARLNKPKLKKMQVKSNDILNSSKKLNLFAYVVNFLSSLLKIIKHSLNNLVPKKSTQNQSKAKMALDDQLQSRSEPTKAELVAKDIGSVVQNKKEFEQTTSKEEKFVMIGQVDRSIKNNQQGISKFQNLENTQQEIPTLIKNLNVPKYSVSDCGLFKKSRSNFFQDLVNDEYKNSPLIR